MAKFETSDYQRYIRRHLSYVEFRNKKHKQCKGKQAVYPLPFLHPPDGIEIVTYADYSIIVFSRVFDDICTRLNTCFAGTHQQTHLGRWEQGECADRSKYNFDQLLLQNPWVHIRLHVKVVCAGRSYLQLVGKSEQGPQGAGRQHLGR